MRVQVLGTVAVLAAGAVVALAGPAAADLPSGPRCDRVALQVPDGVSTILTDAEPTGRFQFGQTDVTGSHLIVWDDGVPRDLGPVSAIAGVQTSLRAINASGTIVGSGQNGAFRFSTQTGAVDPLPRPAGAVSAYPTAVNAAGAVAGVARMADGMHAPVVWSATNTPTLLPVPSPWPYADAEDIDDDGTVVGTLTNWDDEGDYHDQAFVWRADGTTAFLDSATAGGQSQAVAVRNGRAVGQDVTSGRARVWTVATAAGAVVDVPLFGTDINAAGHVSATTEDGDGDDAVIKDGRQHAVTSPAATDRWQTTGPLTDSGALYGYVMDADFDATPYRWTCPTAT